MKSLWFDALVNRGTTHLLPKGRRAPAVRAARSRPCLEPLESRDLLALFSPPVAYAVGPSGAIRPQGMAVADLNGDGALDLVVANGGHFDAIQTGHVSVLLGNGDGTFQNQLIQPNGQWPVDVAIGDVDGDGCLDLVSTNVRNHTVGIYLGNGDGTFRGPTMFAVGRSPLSVALADLDADGLLDVVTANNLDGSVSTLPGNGDGTFRDQVTIAVGSRPLSVAVADFNGDGAADLVAANGFPDSHLSVLPGNGDGSFQDEVTFAVEGSPRALRVADVNGDGRFDVVAGNGVRIVSVLLGSADDILEPARTFVVSDTPFFVKDVVVDDFDGDGALDLVAASDFGRGVLLQGDGTGEFRVVGDFIILGGFGQSLIRLTAGDFNGDGLPDLAGTPHGSSVVFVVLNEIGLAKRSSISVLAELQLLPFLSEKENRHATPDIDPGEGHVNRFDCSQLFS